MPKRRALSLIASLTLSLAACSERAPSSPPRAVPASPAPSPQPLAAPGAREHFGAAFSDTPAIGLAGLLGNPGARPDHPVQVEGMVRRACTRRGCWLELATAMDDDAPGCRVVLKDHAFFVPLDSAGARARVEGYVETKTVPAALVAHMEEEGGRFANKNADGTATEVRIIASGVELQRL